MKKYGWQIQYQADIFGRCDKRHRIGDIPSAAIAMEHLRFSLFKKIFYDGLFLAKHKK